MKNVAVRALLGDGDDPVSGCDFG